MRRRQMRRNLLVATEGVTARIGFDLGSVQRDSFQGNQPFGAQHPQYLREQIIEASFVLRPESRQRAMTHALHPAQPLTARFIFALP